MIKATVNNIIKSSIIKNKVKVLILGVLVATSSILLAGKIFADTVQVPVGQQGETVETPRTGQSMQQIESHFGQPIEKIAAVGEPPITRWRYAQFTVYFEHDKVIHAVVHSS